MKKILVVLSFFIALNAKAAGPLGSAIAPPTYVGYLEEYGDLGWTSATSPYKNKFKIAMPFAAHKICDFWIEGSRAAEYDDFKYIYAKLKADFPGKYFVMDPFKMRNGTTYTYKTGQIVTNTTATADMFCKNYTSKSSSDKTFVINTSINNIEEVACNEKIRIACVKD